VIQSNHATRIALKSSRNGEKKTTTGKDRSAGLRVLVRADEKLTAFIELERAICIHLLTEQV